MKSWLLLILVAIAALSSSPRGAASEFSPDAGTLASIAHDIEGLKKKYPQLEEFSSQGNLDSAALTISYAYRTHQAKRSGGWTAGVPNPDEDGIWFYLEFHDPASVSQIHTQPVTIARQCLGDKAVAFLILEGTKTKSVNGAIWHVLRKHGVAECPHQHTEQID